MVAQILAVTIFVAMFVLIVIDKIERQYITLGCGVLTLVVVFGLCMHSVTAITDTLNIHSIFTGTFWYTGGAAEESSSGINWATIIFVAGMMVMVEGMARVGFFRWLCMRIAKLVHYKTMAIFMTFMIMSAVLSMFIDSITVILFLAAVTVELSQLLKFNPVPMILSEIFCANLGGSATMCGDPPNIIIGTSLGYSFADFITNTGLIALVALVAVLVYFYFVFNSELSASNGENVDISMTIKSKKEEKKYNKNDDGMSIAERIEKLELQISDLCSSSVYQTIDKMHISLVTSPIKKTNVILKNVNFQYALTLWNYMQTHMEDDVKKEKKNKDYYDEGRLRKCIDESFLLDYLVLNSINNDNSSVDKNALSEKIASNMVEKIMSIDADIDEKKLKDIIEKQYSVIKYKTVVNEKQIEDTFKKYMDKYLKDVREVKL